MEPVTAGILAAQVITPLVGGFINRYHAAKAQGASERILREMEREWERIKPVNYPYDIRQPPELHYEALQDPKYAPALEQTAQLIQEKNPELIKDSADMRMGRDAQQNALRRYLQIASSKDDPEYAAAIERASRRAGADAQSRQASLMQNYQRRGLGGSGLELQSQLGSQALANEQQGMQSMEAAAQAYKNRLAALASGAELGGRIYNQDMTQQQINMNAINAFNQRAAQNRQNYEMDRQNFLINERDRQDRIAGDAYNRAYNERAYKGNLALTNADLRRRYEQDLKDRADTQYGQNLDLLRARSGLATNRADRVLGRAQDEMARRQGVFDTVGAGLGEANRYRRNSARDAQYEEDRRRRRHFEDQYARSQGWASYPESEEE
jgi:hypothetical protein